MATVSAAAPSDTTHLFANENPLPKSRCPTSKKVKAVAREALYGGLLGAVFGAGVGMVINIDTSACIIGMGALEGFLTGAVAVATRKIAAYKTLNRYDPLCHSGLIGAGVGLVIGLAIGAGLGAATAAMGCSVGPIGGIGSGMMTGALSGPAVPLLRLCACSSDPYAIDNDIEPTPPPTPTPLEDPSASDI